MNHTTASWTFGVLALLAGAATGCSSSPNGSTVGTAGTPGDGGGASVAEDGGLSVAPGVAQTFIGPIPVAAGQEETVCIVKDLGNDDDLVVSGFDAALAPGSHHLIVYRTTEDLNDTPTPCAPFVGLLEGTAQPVMVINRLSVNWAFPTGVAIELPPHQRLRIEAHYINASANAIQGMGLVSFQGTPKAMAGAWQAADFLFWGTTQINIPPSAAVTVGPKFQAGVPGTTLISITTHQHELGTGIEVWNSSTPGDLSSTVTNDRDWTNPSWRLLDAPIPFTGTNGLSFQCSWDNTTTQPVGFGESALDEMCFTGGYYYPSHGFSLCLDGQCQFGTPATGSDGGN